MLKFVFIAALVVLSGAVQAKTLTAICKSPQGTTTISGTKLVNDSDGFGNGQFTYSWNVGDKTATVISQSGSAAGSVPETAPATVILFESFVTFAVAYQDAIWVHSLNPKRGEVMITRHLSLEYGQGPAFVGGLYFAKCDVAVK